MVTKAKSYIPEGYHSLTAYLLIHGAAQALEFYRKAFDAMELFRFPTPDGRIGHAELQIGDSRIMLADEVPEMNLRGPQALGGSPVGIHLYVEDCDATFKKAVAAGAVVDRPVVDQFYGDRSGSLFDPWGHRWTVATHVEEVSPEEMQERMQRQRG